MRDGKGGECRDSVRLANGIDDFLGLGERLDHLKAFLSSANRIFAFLEKIVQLIRLVEIFKKFTLHLIFGIPVRVRGCLRVLLLSKLTGRG